MKPKTKTTIAQIGVIIFLATFAALSAGAQTTAQNTQKIQKVCIGIKADKTPCKRVNSFKLLINIFKLVNGITVIHYLRTDK